MVTQILLHKLINKVLNEQLSKTELFYIIDNMPTITYEINVYTTINERRILRYIKMHESKNYFITIPKEEYDLWRLLRHKAKNRMNYVFN